MVTLDTIISSLGGLTGGLVNYLRKREQTNKSENKRVYPKVPFGGLGVQRENPLILRYGGYTGKTII